MMTVLLQEMTWPEVKAAVDRNAALVLPAGATEQHGPHLPIGTDTFLPVELLKRAAERIDLLIAPPLHYGYKSRPLSGGGQGFVGTTSLRGKTLIDVTRDVVSEYLRHGFRRILIVNWHMESSSFLYERADLAVREAGLGGAATAGDGSATASTGGGSATGAGSSAAPESRPASPVYPGRAAADAQVFVVEDAWPVFTPDELDLLFPDGFPGWDSEHAAVVETSLMMVLMPGLVRRDRIADDRSPEHPRYDIVPPPARILSQSGVLAKATDASDEKGHFLAKRMTDYLVEVFSAEFPDLVRG